MRWIACILIALLTAFAATDACGKRTTRRKLAAPEATARPALTMAARTGMVSIDRYDKPLRSRYESMFVTNHTDTALTSLKVRIQYITLEGDTIHEAVRQLRSNIPAKATRRVTFSSWDKQLTFYYHLTDKPSRLKGTPYDVKISPLELTINPSSNDR